MLIGLLEIWERVSEEESVKKSECGLSCWLVLPAARKRKERMCALSCWLACPAASHWGSKKGKTGQVCSARKACVEESERMLSCLCIVARGSDLGRMAWNILIGRKYEFGTKTVKIFLHQTIIWNSFCYNLNLIFIFLYIFWQTTYNRERLNAKRPNPKYTCISMYAWLPVLPVEISGNIGIIIAWIWIYYFNCIMFS